MSTNEAVGTGVLIGSVLTIALQIGGAVWAAWYGERKLRLL